MVRWCWSDGSQRHKLGNLIGSSAGCNKLMRICHFGLTRARILGFDQKRGSGFIWSILGIGSISISLLGGRSYEGWKYYLTAPDFVWGTGQRTVYGFFVQIHFLPILRLLFIVTLHLCECLSPLALPFLRWCTTKKVACEDCCLPLCHQRDWPEESSNWGRESQVTKGDNDRRCHHSCRCDLVGHFSFFVQSLKVCHLTVKVSCTVRVELYDSWTVQVALMAYLH